MMSEEVTTEAAESTSADSTATEASTESTAQETSNTEAVESANQAQTQEQTEGETQGEHEGGEAEGESEGEESSEGAPESYEEFALPEGFTLEGERLEQATEFFKENNWTQEQAQQGVDMFMKMQQQQIESQMQAFNDTQAEWVQTINEDPEIGGANKDASVAAAQKALATFGTPELNKMLGLPTEDNPTGTGLGNNPELVRLMARIGAAISEDSVVVNQGKGTPKTHEERLYPSQA